MILVTGGTGYIGSHTVVELQKAGYPVVIIDNLSNSNRDVLDGIERITGIRPEFVEADCTDMPCPDFSTNIPELRELSISPRARPWANPCRSPFSIIAIT